MKLEIRSVQNQYKGTILREHISVPSAREKHSSSHSTRGSVDLLDDIIELTRGHQRRKGESYRDKNKGQAGTIGV